MVYDDLVWFQGDVYANKKQSLTYLNKIASKFYQNLTSIDHDPFNPKIRLNDRL